MPLYLFIFLKFTEDFSINFVDDRESFPLCGWNIAEQIP
jgi:hypothetical protein